MMGYHYAAKQKRDGTISFGGRVVGWHEQFSKKNAHANLFFAFSKALGAWRVAGGMAANVFNSRCNFIIRLDLLFLRVEWKILFVLLGNRFANADGGEDARLFFRLPKLRKTKLSH